MSGNGHPTIEGEQGRLLKASLDLQEVAEEIRTLYSTVLRTSTAEGQALNLIYTSITNTAKALQVIHRNSQLRTGINGTG